jgi:hypothetical protein
LVIVGGYWPLSIGYGYWLLIFTLQKCGYGYNPFWLLPIVHGYAYNPLAIGHWLVVLAIDIYTRAIVGIVITNWLLPIVNGYALNPLAIGYGYWPL